MSPRLAAPGTEHRTRPSSKRDPRPMSSTTRESGWRLLQLLASQPGLSVPYYREPRACSCVDWIHACVAALSCPSEARRGRACVWQTRARTRVPRLLACLLVCLLPHII